MKKIIGLISILTIAFACCKSTEENKLKTGDLLFFGLPKDYISTSDSTMAGAIADATGGKDSLDIIHVAIIEAEADSVWIIDATIKHGTDRHPLDTTLKDFTLRDGSLPVLIVKRLPDNVDGKAAVERAKSYIGLPYDVHFLPDNDAMYCSELVREAFLDDKGEKVFQNKPMNFKDSNGEFPTYWVWLFGQLGEPIPQDIPGTNPKDMSLDPLLKDVNIKIGW